VLTSFPVQLAQRSNVPAPRPGPRPIDLPAVVVRRAPWRGRHGAILQFERWAEPCAIGRSGMTAAKREGEGATPIACRRILGGFARRDRLEVSPLSRGLVPICARLGWCDEPNDRRYNTPVVLPFSASHERMWRDDHQYDFCLVWDWNLSRRIRNRGSAVFLHLARPGLAPTAGCIAVAPATMRRLLRSGIIGRRLRTVP
jgi:L,D-peptidoglycan transpeptidase YkuD (ErfK/YbiS/YcfS/YnhG family)